MVLESQRFPARLVDGDDPQAELLRRALAEPPLGPSELQSWQGLSARPQRAGPRVVLPVFAGALVLAALAAWASRPRSDVTVSAEILRQRAEAPRASAASSALGPLRPASPSVVERAKAGPRSVAVPSAGSASSASPTEPDAAACAKLAKAGEYSEASSCYGRVARGGSMTAELALYEKARLEARALGNGAQALSTLDEHRRRFPGGVLSSEVAFTRIDLLMQLGKHTEALAAIDEGLHGALGRERGADLQLMRASLLATSGDCGAALRAASSARDAGIHPSRLEAVERRCGTGSVTPGALEP